MRSIHPIIAGSNQPLEVAFSDASSEAATNLTGCTGFTASARETDTGTVIVIPNAVLVTAAEGKVKLEWADDTFLVPGLYAVQVRCIDVTGHTLILPSEAGQLLLRVGPANL